MFSLGRPDHAGDRTDRVDRETMLSRVAEIVDAVPVPVSADLEDGYGDTPEAVATTVADALAAGAVGGNIEDFTGEAGRPLHDTALGIDRIQAARAVVDAQGAGSSW